MCVALLTFSLRRGENTFYFPFSACRGCQKNQQNSITLFGVFRTFWSLQFFTKHGSQKNQHEPCDAFRNFWNHSFLQKKMNPLTGMQFSAFLSGIVRCERNRRRNLFPNRYFRMLFAKKNSASPWRWRRMPPSFLRKKIQRRRGGGDACPPSFCEKNQRRRGGGDACHPFFLRKKISVAVAVETHAPRFSMCVLAAKKHPPLPLQRLKFSLVCVHVPLTPAETEMEVCVHEPVPVCVCTCTAPRVCRMERSQPPSPPPHSPRLKLRVHCDRSMCICTSILLYVCVRGEAPPPLLVRNSGLN